MPDGDTAGPRDPAPREDRAIQPRGEGTAALVGLAASAGDPGGPECSIVPDMQLRAGALLILAVAVLGVDRRAVRAEGA